MTANTMVVAILGMVAVTAVGWTLCDVVRSERACTRPVRQPRALLDRRDRRPTVAELRERHRADTLPYYSDNRGGSEGSAMIDIPLSLRLTVAFAALGALPGLMLARWLAELVRRRWSPSYAAARLRGRRHARRVRRARRLQFPAGADDPDSAPAGSTALAVPRPSPGQLRTSAR